MQSVKSLQRWGCLEHLQQLTVQMVHDDTGYTSSDVMKANLKAFSTCLSLEPVVLKSSYIDQKVLGVLDVDLFSVNRSVASSGVQVNAFQRCNKFLWSKFVRTRTHGIRFFGGHQASQCLMLTC